MHSNPETVTRHIRTYFPQERVGSGYEVRAILCVGRLRVYKINLVYYLTSLLHLHGSLHHCPACRMKKWRGMAWGDLVTWTVV